MEVDPLGVASVVIGQLNPSHVFLGLPAAAKLVECVMRTQGDYVEIGSAYGCSAILAAKGMEGRPGMVFCMDRFADSHELAGIDNAILSFWGNCIRAGVQQRIVAFKHHNPPFPLPIWYHQFSVGLIDGDHSEHAVRDDWNSFKNRVTDYVLFDNFEKDTVSRVVNEIATVREWGLVEVIEHETKLSKHNELAVMGKIK